MSKDEEIYDDLLNGGNSSLSEEVEAFLKKSTNMQLPESKSKEAIWEKIEEQITESDQSSKRRKQRFLHPVVYIGIAAAVTLLATFSILFQNDPVLQVISTQPGQLLTHTLPDGSTVTLNVNSELNYSSEWDRTLDFSGEGFFEVTEGKTFIVRTTSGDVEVLGTSFNVFIREGRFEVACKTGKVKVTIPSKSFAESIEPGGIITLKADTVRKFIRDAEMMGKWQLGEFYFENQPILDVLGELKRQFDIQIEFEGNQQLEFNGYFSSKSIDVALNMVCLPLGLEYEKVDASTVVIKELE